MKLRYPLFLIILAAGLMGSGLTGILADWGIWGDTTVLAGIVLGAGVAYMIWGQFWLREHFEYP